MKITDVTLTLFAWDDIPATSYGAHTGKFSGASKLGLLKIVTDQGITGHAFLGSGMRPAGLDAKVVMLRMAQEELRHTETFGRVIEYLGGVAPEIVQHRGSEKGWGTAGPLERQGRPGRGEACGQVICAVVSDTNQPLSTFPGECSDAGPFDWAARLRTNPRQSRNRWRPLGRRKSAPRAK